MLPAAMRQRMGLRPGDEVRVSEDPSGVLHVASARVAARALVGSAGPVGHSVVDELLADRRTQARAEDRDAAR